PTCESTTVSSKASSGFNSIFAVGIRARKRLPSVPFEILIFHLGLSDWIKSRWLWGINSSNQIWISDLSGSRNLVPLVERSVSERESLKLSNSTLRKVRSEVWAIVSDIVFKSKVEKAVGRRKGPVEEARCEPPDIGRRTSRGQLRHRPGAIL